jgi:hypothetical protein
MCVCVCAPKPEQIQKIALVLCVCIHAPKPEQIQKLNQFKNLREGTKESQLALLHQMYFCREKTIPVHSGTTNTS